MEKILPIIKFIFFNFDYFLIFGILVIWYITNSKPHLTLTKQIIKIGDSLYYSFLKLTAIKTIKLLILFFVLNFAIRILMAFFVSDIFLDKIAYHYLNLARSMYQGEGFTTYVVWNNFLQPPTVIGPDFFRLPLYPFLILLFYKLFGLSYFSAQLLNVIAGSLLPIVSYLFAYLLTKSKRIATLLLIFISFNGLIFKWVTISYPEIIYALAAILFLYFLYQTRDKINFSSVLVGIFWAAAYLLRAEGLYIFLPVIIFYYYNKQPKKQFISKMALTVFGFLIIASPYLARNYVLTKNPFYSEFDRITMVAYIGRDYLVESPTVEYKNIYDLALKNPFKTIKSIIVEHIGLGLILIPQFLITSYVITVLSLIGIFYVLKKDRQKYYFIFLSMITGFLLPVVGIGFEDRYLIFLIILFYFFAALAVFKLYDTKLKNNALGRSAVAIYLFIFIIFNGLVGIGKGTLPLIPHSFYQRFDSEKYFTDLKEFYHYVKNNTPKDEVVMASRRPYEIYYFTERPTVIFPFTDEKGVQQFMKKYQVKWVIWMGQPIIVGDKFLVFWPEGKTPKNITPVFKNAGGDLFKVEYYIDE